MAIGRRQFLSIACGALAVGSGRSALAQRSGTPTIGVLLGLANDPEAQGRIKAFEEALEKEGWLPGRDVKIEYRFAAGDAKRMQALAKELVALRPAVIVGHSTPVVTQLVKVTHTIPIVFVVVADPVGSGFATSIARPGGNVTGFTNLDAGITGKMLTILKQITPDVSGVALMFNPETVAKDGMFYWRPFEEAAPAFGVKPIAAIVRAPADIENVMAQLAHESNAGLIVMPDNFTTVNRGLIISLAARYKIPTIYPYRYFAEAGGLMSYGVDVKDLFRRTPQYVSRILRGANPGELPVQAPTKFELVVNTKTAKALNLTIPKILLASAEALLE